MAAKKRILKNGQTRWEDRAWITEDGRRVKKNLTAPTKRELDDLRDELRARERRRRHGLPEERGNITYDDLADLFLAQYQHSERSKRSLRERLAYSRTAFGPLNVRDLMPEQIDVWNARLAKQSGEPLSSTMRGHALRAMRQVLAYGVACHYLAENPARGRGPKPRRRHVEPFESWAQVSAVAAKAGKYGPLIRFACATGLRPQEWQAVEWRDVDLNARELRIERTVQDGKIERAGKTDGSLRTVQLQRVALDALRDLLAQHRADGLTFPRGLIFPAPEGGIINLSNYRKRVWKKALADAELPYRALDETRHTFATLALAGSAPIEWVSKQLGHTNIQTTLKHYARWLPAADDRIIALLDAFAASGESDGRKVDGQEEAGDAR
jgi:integrase